MRWRERAFVLDRKHVEDIERELTLPRLLLLSLLPPDVSRARHCRMQCQASNHFESTKNPDLSLSRSRSPSPSLITTTKKPALSLSLSLSLSPSLFSLSPFPLLSLPHSLPPQSSATCTGHPPPHMSLLHRSRGVKQQVGHNTTPPSPSQLSRSVYQLVSLRVPFSVHGGRCVQHLPQPIAQHQMSLADRVCVPSLQALSRLLEPVTDQHGVLQDLNSCQHGVHLVNLLSLFHDSLSSFQVLRISLFLLSVRVFLSLSLFFPLTILGRRRMTA